ncbi:dihydrolipoyl dehydrogenase [Guggenheimella bovis]
MKDLIIIGGGPAGYTGALKAHLKGLDVTVIERDRLGGTCLNRGCIPTKALVKNAEVIRSFREREHYGILSEDFTIDYSKVKERKDNAVETLVKGLEGLFQGKKIEVIKGDAKFIDQQTIEVNGEKLQAKNFIIATGSVPQIANFEGSDLEGLMTSDDALELQELPKSLTILGGGVIACEFASIFNALGVEVSLVASKIVKREDEEIQKRLALFFKKQGIKLYVGARHSKVEKTENGYKTTFPTKKGDGEVETEAVLVATGRMPNIESLGLDNAGLKYDTKGIIVNTNYETNIPHIYACGDCTNTIELAHVASAECEAIIDIITGKDTTIDYRYIPNCTFTYPEIASVGLTEAELKEQGIPYEATKSNFIANGKAVAMSETDGFVKVLSSPDGLLLGVHIIGIGASELIAEATLAMKNNISGEAIIGTIHAHPTLPEAFKEAVEAFIEPIHQI